MMTNSWMEVLSPYPAYFSNSHWILEEKKSGNWTQQENKMFENALAHFDEDTPDRWDKVAEMIPGKTVDDIKSHYRDLEQDVSCIEAGLVPFPGYSSSSFTLDWENNHFFDGLNQSCYVDGDGGGGGGGGGGGRRAGRFVDHERKKGVPWTEEEHKRFLLGLKKYGKGDWRNISRNFVVTRTPTQVASHAQKYFIRLNSGTKDKRRASIHDITTVSLEENRSPSPPSQPSAGTMQSSSTSAPAASEQFSIVVDSRQPNEAASAFSALPSAYGIFPYGMKLQAQSSYYRNLNGAVVGQNGVLF